jgi:hypothetical protein
MRTDGQTGTTKLNVAFRNFANAPKSISCVLFNAIEWTFVKKRFVIQQIRVNAVVLK